MIGANEYFGWYARLGGRPALAHQPTSGPFLDRTHALYPGKPLFVTEFGAESNRNGRRHRAGHLRLPEQVDDRTT